MKIIKVIYTTDQSKYFNKNCKNGEMCVNYPAKVTLPSQYNIMNSEHIIK